MEDNNSRANGERAKAALHVLSALATTGAKGAALAAAQEAAPWVYCLREFSRIGKTQVACQVHTPDPRTRGGCPTGPQRHAASLPPPL